MTGTWPLQSLTSFTVTADYHRHATTLDVWPEGRPAPEARLHKDGPVLDLDPFRVLTGPRLDEPDGQVSRTGAWAPDGTRIGTVTHLVGRTARKLDRYQVSPAKLQASRWRVEQVGLPVVSGGPAGAIGRLRFNALTDFLLESNVLTGHNPVDYLLPFAFRFAGEGLSGFEISRSAGRSRLSVTVHDPRIDRRLVLACVVSVNSLHNPTLSQAAVNLTTNPRRGSRTGRPGPR